MRDSSAVRSSLVVAVLALALIGALTVTRGTPVGSVVTLSGSGPASRQRFAVRAHVRAVHRHARVSRATSSSKLLNGDGTYPRLWATFARRKHTITVQMYYSLPGKVADTMAAILTERARANVRVLFLARCVRLAAPVARVRTVAARRRASRSRGCARCTGSRFTTRAIDRTCASWSSTARRIHRRFRPRRLLARRRTPRGPVARVERAVRGAGGDGAAGGVRRRVGRGDRRADHRATVLSRGRLSGGRARRTPGLLYTAPTTGSTPAERFLALTISGARKTLYITNSYFVPDDDFRRLLERAVRRGVDVRVLTVSTKTDVKTTWYAGRYRYEELLRAASGSTSISRRCCTRRRSSPTACGRRSAR